jgi:hypothetical protein
MEVSKTEKVEKNETKNKLEPFWENFLVIAYLAAWATIIVLLLDIIYILLGY